MFTCVAAALFSMCEAFSQDFITVVLFDSGVLTIISCWIGLDLIVFSTTNVIKKIEKLFDTPPQHNTRPNIINQIILILKFKLAAMLPPLTVHILLPFRSVSCESFHILKQIFNGPNIVSFIIMFQPICDKNQNRLHSSIIFDITYILYILMTKKNNTKKNTIFMDFIHLTMVCVCVCIVPDRIFPFSKHAPVV